MTAPGWAYVVGAIVGVLGLLWAIVSHFIPKAERVKPSPPAAMPARSESTSVVRDVNVTGNANIVVPHMSGGTINNGVPASQADSPVKE